MVLKINIAENRVESLDDKFAVATAVIVAGANKKSQKRKKRKRMLCYRLSHTTRAHHFPAWNKTVF